jgi:hypothetical protein
MIKFKSSMYGHTEKNKCKKVSSSSLSQGNILTGTSKHLNTGHPIDEKILVR